MKKVPDYRKHVEECQAARMEDHGECVLVRWSDGSVDA
jgi:hypothetical protein